MFAPFRGFDIETIDLYKTKLSIDGNNLCMKLRDVYDTKERFASQNIRINIASTTSPYARYKDDVEVIKEYFGDAGAFQVKSDSTNNPKFFSGCMGSATTPTCAPDYRLLSMNLSNQSVGIYSVIGNPNALGMLKLVISSSSTAPTTHLSGPGTSVFASVMVNIDDIKDKEMLIEYYQDNVPCKVKVTLDTEINCFVFYASNDPGHTSTAWMHIYAYNKAPV